MKILFYRWNVFYQEDIIEVFENMGYTVDTLKQGHEEYNEDEAFTREIIRRIKEDGYSMVFSVNYFGTLSDACESCNIPYVSWSCDSPLISMYHRSVYNEHNYIFLFDKFFYYVFKAMGAKHVFYLPLCVNVKRLDSLFEYTKNEDLSRYDSDISMVGNLYERNCYDDIEDKLPEYLRGYFDGIMQAQLGIYGDNIIDSMLTPEIIAKLSPYIDFVQSQDSFSSIPLVFANTFLGFKIARTERIEVLNRLSRNHRVDLYTPSPTDMLPMVNNRGTLDYQYAMPHVFRRSKINLNLSLRNIRTGIPLRVWDVLGAGGFLISNYQVEMDDFFENGKSIVYFEDFDDLEKKVDYYLEHDEERENIAREGYRIVSKNNSYVDRIKYIMENVFTNTNVDNTNQG